MRIALNGFGRIGRSFLRIVCADAQARKQLQVAVINVGPANPAHIAYEFQYDSVMGRFDGKVSYNEQSQELIINDQVIPVIAVSQSSKLDWQPYSIDWVVDASGQYTSAKKAEEHLQAGAPCVLITAPCKGDVTTIIPGVNMDTYDSARDRVVSLGSCTTNAIMPLLSVAHTAYGIKRGFMTTIHAYTNTQSLLDGTSSDKRRSRAAALNIIPTSTGADKLIGQIMPELAGRIDATAVRVPVANVSLLDVVLQLSKEATVDQLNDLYRQEAQQGQLKGILAVSDDACVSSDYMQSPYSVIMDLPLTQQEDGMCKFFGWYDNEWGYSQRLKDFLLYVE